jgi:hypothetical protein
MDRETIDFFDRTDVMAALTRRNDAFRAMIGKTVAEAESAAYREYMAASAAVSEAGASYSRTLHESPPNPVWFQFVKVANERFIAADEKLRESRAAGEAAAAIAKAMRTPAYIAYEIACSEAENLMGSA